MEEYVKKAIQYRKTKQDSKDITNNYTFMFSKLDELQNQIQEIIKDKNNYEEWAHDLMDMIEEIAEERYPNVPYWLDTENRYQCCIEMLEQFRRDL